ncbi:MAG: disulfide oxidoreductase [Alphaproteobacteria bacterium]|nr:disulfide oxidoreductase [Alphaproteobacteria bacterium]
MNRWPIQAVLGPTNTGKTHLAMERMLGHASGMIGFPLRLLARENYDRAVAAKGKGQVALVTGEEKIVPPNARYFVCTVESMPLDRPVEFVAVDEIQMCADSDRGHVFTDRLLRARGISETMFMGAETIRPLLRRLAPDAEFSVRPRLSTLRYSGPRKIQRLAPRSAVVTFAAADVYAIAEQVRRTRGGAAVVLGALSPRTRNAQVAMYQAGEVDYLVATDAIGMGLNMDIDHVAFAALRKFDGRESRALGPGELAQTAGRAGRHMNDGTFGVTGEVEALDEETVERIENHRFDSLRLLRWRNSDLDFSSLAAFQKSLKTLPSSPDLVRAREADDELVLDALARDADIAAAAGHSDGVRLLWAVCQVPDFRKVMSEAHARLLRRLFLHLAGPEGRLPADWVADQIARLDRAEGDIDALVQRIANIRTWTYVAYQAGWLADSAHWQDRARAVEDRLSDALHDRLTQRFVDRRTALLVARMKENQPFVTAVGRDGRVIVEGETVGWLDGFRFTADNASGDVADRAVAGAAQKALSGEVRGRVRTLEDDPDSAFSFGAGVEILWRGAVVAKLGRGASLLAPHVVPITGDLLDGPARERIRRRLAGWMEKTLAAALSPLVMARGADVSGPARGIVFQLAESLGSMPRSAAGAAIAALDKAARHRLKTLGVVIGRESVFFPALLKPKAAALRARLFWAANGAGEMPPIPEPGRTWIGRDVGVPDAFLESVGFRAAGPLAVRLDVLERIAAGAWALVGKEPFIPPPALLNPAGCGADEMAAILTAIGFKETTRDGQRAFRPRRRRLARVSPPGRHVRAEDSPFAVLKTVAAGPTGS